ncbi:MAG: ECF transporter S component [Clostridia bacterium]|nr:ECF transporter S component [Clostridia bacterium]
MKTAFDGTKALKHLTLVAMFMGLNIIMSSFGIAVPGGHLYLNDIIICTAALIFDPVSAFLVGGVGAFLGDLIFYPTPMFVTLAVRGLQAIAIALIVRYAFKNKKKLAVALALALGAIIMIVGYSLGRAFIYATPEAALLKLPTQIAMAALGVITAPLLVYKAGIGRMYGKFVGKNKN